MGPGGMPITRSPWANNDSNVNSAVPVTRAPWAQERKEEGHEETKF